MPQALVATGIALSSRYGGRQLLIAAAATSEESLYGLHVGTEKIRLPGRDESSATAAARMTDGLTRLDVEPELRREAASVREAAHTRSSWLEEAEGEGFEPSIRLTTDNGFRDRRIRPLCHPSIEAEKEGFEPSKEVSTPLTP